MIYLLGRYWNELEVDFAAKYPGVSLEALWRHRRFRKLLNLIDHLPRDTHYREATSKDIDLAMAFMQSEDYESDDNKPSRPSMHEDDAVVRGLRDVSNQLRLLRVERTGNKNAKPHLLEGPETAMGLAKHRHRKKSHFELAARLLPHRREELLAKAKE